MKLQVSLLLTATLVAVANHSAADDEVELETTFIRDNKELPQVLYIVPWKDVGEKNKKKEPLILHSLFGDAFDPVIPKNLGQ